MAMLPRITKPPSASRTTSGAGGLPSLPPLSPTISSSKSSTVAMPATVPCSSITTASGWPLLRISRSNSEPTFVSGMNGHNVWPRRHDFAHTLVAEFHDLLDQVGLLRFDDSFLFRGFHQRFNPLLRALLFGLLDFVLRDPRERFRTFQEHAHRPNKPHRAANQ